MNTKSALRQELLAARRALDPRSRDRAARLVARLVRSTSWLARGRRIGLYASMRSELGTAPLLELALDRGCEVYLPRITSIRARTMRFVRYTGVGTEHAWGMHEPEGHDTLSARFLDTIFVPAVALDARGARLGLGAGFYDRTLAFRRLRQHWRGPRLIALAYAFQIVDEVPETANDVRMDFIVTERGIDALLAHEDRTLDVRHR